METKDKLSKFFQLFNDLHHAMRKQGHVESDRFIDAFQYFLNLKGNNIIKQHQEEIDLIRQLRNTLTHETTSRVQEIAIPSDYTMDLLESIVVKLTDPLQLMPFLASRGQNQVQQFQAQDSLDQLLKTIAHFRFSQYPVFEDQTFLGLVSENAITNWLVAHMDQALDTKGVTIKEVLTYETHQNMYGKIWQKASIYDVVQLAETMERVVPIMVLAFPNLEIRSPKDIVGILTPSDLAAIYALL